MKPDIAILFQSAPAPAIGGIIKPMKEGGYSDSGADIAYALREGGYPIVTPATKPDITEDKDWVFSDSSEGIQTALNLGANTLWLNTVLYSDHPITQIYSDRIFLVGQPPLLVDRFDDKLRALKKLSDAGLPVPAHQVISQRDLDIIPPIDFPMVLKPIRGRGSQGVQLIKGIQDYSRLVRSFFEKGLYGDLAYLEAYLTGPEITVTVMPPGMYIINHQNVEKTDYWCLPPVSRFNHINGIAPYNGVVAVVNNSQAMGNEAIKNDRIVTVLRYCSMAGAILKPKAPIRIDCRANEKGTYAIFDVNFKPNMTGASRPQRADQDSLTMIAAKKMGWKYIDLLTNMLHSAWSSDEQSV